MNTQDLYKEQANALYDLIMASSQEWRKSWSSEDFFQRNGLTDTPYSNLNQSLLFSVAIAKGLEDPRWLTFNQAQSNDLKVKKGSKGYPIYKLITTYERKMKDENGKPLKDKDGRELKEEVAFSKPILKKFTVFNANDIEGIEPYKKAILSPEQEALLKQENYALAEETIKIFCEKNNITLKEIPSSRAFHSYAQSNNGATDKQVVIPLKAQFDSLDEYFSTLFHEVGHATKHLDIRINQETDTEKGNIFGSRNYAREDLTAELTALFLCKQFKIDSSEAATREQNSLAYLKSWIKGGLLTKEDFQTATIEANRSAKAILAETQSIKLTNEENIVLGDSRMQQRYTDLKNEVNNLNNGSPIYIDFAEKLLEKKYPLTTNEKAAMQESIGIDNYQKLELRASIYLNQWMQIQDSMLNKGISKNSTISNVAKIINETENKTELKAVVFQILENENNSGRLSNEQFTNTLNKYKENLDKTAISKTKKPQSKGLKI